MRRTTPYLVLGLGAALLFAGGASAGNAGFAPVTPHSPNASRIGDSYDLISIVTGGVLVVVEGALVGLVIRFRRRGRPRSAEGQQLPGHIRLGLLSTVAVVVLLAIIGSIVLYKLPGITDIPKVSAADRQLSVTVDAHQFYWQFDYPNGAISIGVLHVPVGKVVRVAVISHDVDHSWWIPALAGQLDAIPGRVSHLWFKADQVGTYRGQCAEFCGLFHDAMGATVLVTSQADYDAWISRQASANLGRDEFAGACVTCHGTGGQGGYGPSLTHSAILTQPAALKNIVLNGRGRMPPVGLGWNDRQMNALFQYTQAHVAGGSSNGR